MIVGIGIDLCRFSRIRALISRKPGQLTRFATRILHQSEWAEFQRLTGENHDADHTHGHSNQSTVISRPLTGEVSDAVVRYLSTRWAAKEAAYKALFPHRLLTWKEVAVVKRGNEAKNDAVEKSSSGPLSKNAQKRLLKAQQREARQEERKAFFRAHRKARKVRRRELIASGTVPTPPPRKQKFGGVQTDITVVLDMAFDHLMTDKEIISIASQVTRCYSVNRVAEKMVSLMATGFGGRAKERLERANDAKDWKGFAFEEKSYLDLFPKDRLVYLTADSDNVLETLEDDKIYILGAFVDRNRYKGLTYQKAQEQGIATAQLPIGKYLKLTTRKVLTVNQVLEIMLLYLETGDWEKAMLQFIPHRKLLTAQPAQPSASTDATLTENSETPSGEKCASPVNNS
ncbi:tRNA (guanine(9)-N(1))-methyltransferase [Dispira parvispora]|uniref:tRNA (guanine(9)-N1)-methyltransferase n=1 Tax=Dispira parvispora TaxID=1520584 RepID=A0A9W8ARY9_9FUNG|nr:tRNA (guanine(9)-N(1))-methyltransferase [Dispira parvispora]